MGRIRYLLADLYFVDGLNGVSLLHRISKSVESAVLAWSGRNTTVKWIEAPVQGWSGLCPLITGYMTLLVIPMWDYMALAIISLDNSLDPKALCELIVAKLEPSVVSVDSLVKGTHLQGV